MIDRVDASVVAVHELGRRHQRSKVPASLIAMLSRDLPVGMRCLAGVLSVWGGLFFSFLCLIVACQ